MKVELLLNDDIELRAYIKELIKNEVINISRTEISDTVKDVLNKKLESTFNTRNIDYLIEQEVVRQIALKVKCYWGNKDKDYLSAYIDNRIKELVFEQFK